MLVISFVALPSLRTASSWRGAASGWRDIEPDVLLYISLPDITQVKMVYRVPRVGRTKYQFCRRLCILRRGLWGSVWLCIL